MAVTPCPSCRFRRVRGGRVINVLDPLDLAPHVRMECRGCRRQIVDRSPTCVVMAALDFKFT